MVLVRLFVPRLFLVFILMLFVMHVRPDCSALSPGGAR